MSDAAQNLEEAFAAAGLTRRQTAVVGWRLLGLSFGEITRREGVTRQCVPQTEAIALRKLGPSGSVESIVHARGWGAVRRAGREHLTAVHAVCRGSYRRPERLEREHEWRVAEFFDGCGV
jgi:hypothetical protein